ncbi:MAG: bifunctional adenosylcobinamide kinase/adenosylcobinamide-phosphate guanylyltransferase [Anaerobacillus sp.]|uniref:bifunctional adenosylcobinamide kinase/adenosylcobinamide-phosphate guanylyltransferase n=1 Tax=Anaerobacillus sp. TaxID=1872506 RepID=UPI00391902E9
MLVFITGGVRSGKSSFAEKLAYSLVTPVRNKLIYIATSKKYDTEIEIRIQKHQEQRNESGFTWETWEQSTGLELIYTNLKQNQVILIDCLTTLIANELFRNLQSWDNLSIQQDISERIMNFLIDAQKNNFTLLIVSNELLNGGLYYSKATLTYMKLIGELHQKIVQTADDVYLVEAGIPLKLKGCVKSEH